MARSDTLTTHAGASTRRQPETGPALFLVLDLDRLDAAAPARFSLTGVDRVAIGRGEQQRSRREGGRLEIAIDDRRMSSLHAQLERVLGRWMLIDAGSKNGVLVDGARVTRTVLEDEMVFELGHSFFLFREAVPLAPDADAAALAPPAADLATLSPALAERFDGLTRVARSAGSVVITGESGTGKELAARAVHALSGRTGQFVAVNCGAIPASLVESELFGSRKGAFSGATEDRPGLIRGADHGTLFLDEIGDLPLGSQAAFLRALQEREVLPVGGGRPVPVDFRLVAATHRDLDALFASGTFRADLLARIAGFRLELPPLRDRLEDLGLLVAAIVSRIGGATPRRITRDVARALFAHEWPLNIRELETSLSTAAALAGADAIDVSHLPAPLAEAAVRPPSASVELSPEDSARRDAILGLLREHQGNVSSVARAMGKARPLVHRWIVRYGIDVKAFRKDA